MHRPAYSRVLSGGCDWGKSLAWTCLAISISCAARRSDSSLPARARRCASTAWVTSSKLTSEKELPSGSLKRVKTPPQIGAGSVLGAEESAGCGARTCTSYLRRLRRGAKLKRTPRLVHSRYLAITSSVTKVTAVGRPISWHCSEPGLGATRVRFAVPSGGATVTKRRSG